MPPRLAPIDMDVIVVIGAGFRADDVGQAAVRAQPVAVKTIGFSIQNGSWFAATRRATDPS